MNSKRLALAFVALLPSLCFLACDKDPVTPAQSCTYNSDCTAPLLCLGGQCKPQCVENIDCTNGMSCVEGVCQGGGQGGAGGGMSTSSSSSGMSTSSSSGMGGSGMSSASSSTSGMGGSGMSSSSSSSSGGGACNNNVMDGSETDVDCGGAVCAPCTDGKKCTKSQDCTGGMCNANVCTSMYDLSVIRTGSGQGTVTSAPMGINCGAQCTATYTSGTSIVLTAVAAGDSTFAGWTGAGCSGNGPCNVTMDMSKSVSAKFDLKPTGMAAWQKSYGSNFSTSSDLEDVSFDANGNVLLTGEFTGTVNFGGGPITAVDTDIVVLKLDSAGGYVWSRRIGTNGYESAHSIYGYSTGDVIIGGDLVNGVNTDMGGGATLNCTTAFIAKYSAATGAHVWSKCLGTGSITLVKGVEDAMGNLVTVGFITGTVDFGGGAIVADASGSIFLAKFSGMDGSHVWSRKVAAKAGNLFDISVDAMGNIGLVGSYSGSINVGGAMLPSNGQTDCWVGRYNATGQHVWSKHFGDTGTDEAYGIDFDAMGNLVVSGTYTGAIDFGNGALTNGGGQDAFLVKLTGSNGSLLWANHFGASNSEIGKSVSVAPDGTVIMSGIFYFSTNFGAGTISGVGGADIFVVKYDALGTFLWGKPIGSSDYDDVYAIDTDVNNNSAFVGKFGSYQSIVQKFLP